MISRRACDIDIKNYANLINKTNGIESLSIEEKVCLSELTATSSTHNIRS